MKKLLAKTGYIAATSALLAGVCSTQEAQAITINASRVESLYIASEFVPTPNETSIYARASDPRPGEIGEFVFGEVRTFAEYDISALKDRYLIDKANLEDGDTSNDDQLLFLDKTFSVGFNVASLTGSGAVGSDNGGANDASPYEGFVDAFWYTESAIDNLAFNPVTPFAVPGVDNPLGFFDMSDKEVGDRISLDVTALVKSLIVDQDITNFGFFLTASDYANFNPLINAGFSDGSAGSCGPRGSEDEPADRTLCSGVTFNNFQIVPTPAAVLPTLFGLASAAFRKKNEEESDLDA